MKSINYLILVFILVLINFPISGLAATPVDIDITNPVAIFSTSPSTTSNKIDAFLDWQAITYSPFWYQGRGLPNKSSQIAAGLTFAKNNNNYNDYEYRWLFNEVLIQDWRRGATNVVFKISRASSEALSLRVLGRDGKNRVLDESIKLVLVDPEALIYLVDQDGQRSALSDYKVNINSTIRFEAVPFFFNQLNDKLLDYKWKFDSQDFDDDQAVDKNIFELKTAEIANRFGHSLSVDVFNKKNSSFEWSRYKTTINYK